MKVPIYNQDAKAVGEVELSSLVFGVPANTALLAEVARVQQMNARSARATTKTRADVKGGGKKPWKQKGTGRARAGSIRSPLWRHGGVALGPTGGQNWSRTLNRQVKRSALLMALSDKVKHGKLVVLENLQLETPKTKSVAGMLKLFADNQTGVGKKPLVITPKVDRSLVMSARNLKGVVTASADSLNPLEILTADSVVMLKASVPVVETIYGKAN